MNILLIKVTRYLLVAFAIVVLVTARAGALEYTIQQYSSGQYLGMDLADMNGDGTPELLAGSW